MDVEINPRPNFKYSRSCGNCKFFILKTYNGKKGVCILPDGPKLSANPRMTTPGIKENMNKFKKTHVFCVCDNHQWKSRGSLRGGMKWSGVKDIETR